MYNNIHIRNKVANSSELILNKDGSVYHLALKPGDVSDTVITVGDPDRVSLVSSLFDTIEVRKQKREFVTHTGRMSGKRISVISTGIGTDNVDIVINELHALKVMTGEQDQPYQFVRLGTSGAVRVDQSVDALLLSKDAIGLDGLMNFYKWDKYAVEIENLVDQNEDWKLLPKPYAASCDDALYERFIPLADAVGVTVTAPGFYAPQGRSVNVPARVKNFIQLLEKSSFNGKAITNLEMETAGIYGLSSLLGHEAISISAILANRSTGEFSKRPDEVVARMIHNALEILLA